MTDEMKGLEPDMAIVDEVIKEPNAEPEKAAIVVIFPLPDENDLMGIQRVAGPVKALFSDEKDIKFYALTHQPAKVIQKIVTPKDDESHWVSHARRELALLGNDKPFDDSILAAIQAFSSYGHSGGSAPIATQMIYELLQYKNLTPLTDNPNEWMSVSSAMQGEECWQSRRRSGAFSNDGGKTYYLLEDGSTFVTQKVTYESEHYEAPEQAEEGDGRTVDSPG